MGQPRNSEQTAGHLSRFRPAFPVRPSHGWKTTGPYTTSFSRCALSHSAGGPAEACSLPRHTTCPSVWKKRVGGRMGGLGGRRAPCAPAKGPSFPPKPATSAPSTRTCESGNGFLYSCVGRATAWHTAMSRGPGPKTPVMAREGAFLPAPKGAMQTGKRCPRAGQGPFFTISPLQPSSRGYYELYQGRCLEISCGAPPR